MAKTDFQSIDEYIATFPSDIQKVLEEVRQLIRKAVPEAKETISYQMPCFKDHGAVMFFAAFTNHLSIAVPPPTIDVFKDELKDYKTSKSILQIPFDQPLPVKLITKMAKYRQTENLK